VKWPQWLQGGPFLEVSFLLEINRGKKQQIQEIINKLPEIVNAKIKVDHFSGFR
jgi:hypothetical protein